MKVFAIDTSAKTTGAAVCEDEKLICGIQKNAGFTQSTMALPAVKDLFEKAKVTADGIDIFACTVGPGSFTGVRIGVSLVKGLAFGKNKICIGVSTLEALSYNIKADGAVVVAVMDARQNRYYHALFKVDGDSRTRLCEDDVGTPEEIAGKLSVIDSVIYFVGDGYDAMKALFPAAKETPRDLIYPSGHGVALAALAKYGTSSAEERKNFTDQRLSPVYLRPSQAERNISKE